MREYEASARTVEEAIEQGLEELGVSIGDVDVYVVEEGSSGGGVRCVRGQRAGAAA